MKCTKCGHENRSGAKFCEECAAPLARSCAGCGAQLSQTAKFCSECGHPASAAASPAPGATPRFSAPEVYTPKHLAEKILTSKVSLEGERKQVTALFADLKGSMELFADRDPEEVRKLIDPVIDHMMEAVHRFEGTVNHVLGDGIMALFGAPLAHEDHAVRACYAALRMQENIKHYAEGVRRSEGILIQVRVGLNSGEVVVRSIGSDLRMDYTVVGQTTDVAARMEQMAVPGLPAYLILLDVPIEDPQWQALDPPHAPSAHPRCAEAAAAQGEPGTAPRLGVGGSSLDRFRDAGAARQPDRKHAVGVPFSLLEAIAEQADEALQGGLAHLQSAEFLYQSRLFPDVEYTFKHGLTYEVAYGSLLHERRRALHSRIVAVIEARYPDRLNEQVERLAYHAIRGELWEKATRYLSQAGARALDRSAYREAAPYFEQALSALAHLPETLETRGQGVDFRLGLRNSLFPLGEIEAVIRHLQNAEQLATALDDRLRLARVSVATSHHFLVTGNAEEARKFGTRAFEISETIKDHSLRVAANLYLGAACLALGDFRAAEEHLEKTLRFVEGELVHERFGLHGFPSAILGSYLAWGLAERGDFGAAIARGREGVEIAEAVHHAYSQVYASWGLALAHVLRGDLTEAARILERAEALVREWNLPLMDALVLGLLGLVRARTGHADEGVALLQEAVTAYEKAFGGGSGSR